MAKKNKGSAMNIFRVFLATLLAVTAAGMGYQLYTALRSPIKTAEAMPGSGSEGIALTAIAIREESALTLPGAGYTILARDGTRLEKGADWAAAFASKGQAAEYRKLQEYEALRGRLRALQGSTLTGLSEQKLEAEISGLFLDFLDSTADGTLEREPAAAADLSEKWGVLSALGAGSDYVSQKIAELSSEIKRLDKKIQSGEKLQTPAAGIYVSLTDGFEDGGALSARIEKAHSAGRAPLSVRETEELLSRNAAASSSGGRLVTGVLWHLAANAPVEDAQRLRIGGAYTAETEQLGGRRLRLTLESVGEAGDGTVPLVFSCSAQDEQCLRLRVTRLNIILKEEEGLRVPRAAVHVVNGETGVFVYENGKVYFRRAIVRCAGGDYVIVRALSTGEIESLNEASPGDRSQLALREKQLDEKAEAMDKKRPGSVRRYDRVILEGRDLERRMVNAVPDLR